MKKRIDYIFDEDDYERKIFRFYPRRSHVHGFGDKCPQSWDEVYKVYYTWAIIHQFKFGESTESKWESYTVFTMDCDECSALGDVPNKIKNLKIGEKTNFGAMGNGAEWNIKYCDGNKYFLYSKPYYIFTVWDNFTNQGYRFDLFSDEVHQFSKYIEYVQDYMLKHSEPI